MLTPDCEYFVQRVILVNVHSEVVETGGVEDVVIGVHISTELELLVCLLAKQR